MAVEQDGVAVGFVQSLQLVRQGLVVGQPMVGDAALHLGIVWGPAVAVNRLAAERAGGAQLGVVHTRVHRLVLWRAVQVDEVAAIARNEHAGTEFAGEGIQGFQVPVGVCDLQRFGLKTALLIEWNLGAHVGQADQQRPLATVELECCFW